jgi:hypothetical protein
MIERKFSHSPLCSKKLMVDKEVKQKECSNLSTEVPGPFNNLNHSNSQMLLLLLSREDIPTISNLMEALMCHINKEVNYSKC